MKQYELLCILPGTLSEEEQKPVLEKLKQIVQECGGANLEHDEIGKNRLAYPIKHIRYGYFHVTRFECEDGKNLQALQVKLGLIPELLRVLIRKFDPAKADKTNQDMLAKGTISHISTEKEPRQPRKIERPTTSVKKEEKPVEEEVVEEEKPALDMEEIDKKLDEILVDDISAEV